MMRLEDIKAGDLIKGIEPGLVVRIVTIEPMCNYFYLRSLRSAFFRAFPSIYTHV